MRREVVVLLVLVTLVAPLTLSAQVPDSPRDLAQKKETLLKEKENKRVLQLTTQKALDSLKDRLALETQKIQGDLDTLDSQIVRTRQTFLLKEKTEAELLQAQGTTALLLRGVSLATAIAGGVVAGYWYDQFNKSPVSGPNVSSSTRKELAISVLSASGVGGLGILGFFLTPPLSDTAYERTLSLTRAEKNSAQSELDGLDQKRVALLVEHSKIQNQIDQAEKTLFTTAKDLQQHELDLLELTKQIAEAEKRRGEWSPKKALFVANKAQVKAYLLKTLNLHTEYDFDIVDDRESNAQRHQSQIFSTIDLVASFLTTVPDLQDWSLALDQRATGSWITLTLSGTNADEELMFRVVNQSAIFKSYTQGGRVVDAITQALRENRARTLIQAYRDFLSWGEEK